MKVKFKDQALETEIILPDVGKDAPEFRLVKSDLTEAKLSDYRGKRVILNIFPSIDTPTCATSVQTFNQKMAELNNTVVLCISIDLPFAQSRFCSVENINNVETLSGFRSNFGKDYGVRLNDSPLEGLYTRAIVVIDENGKVVYNQVVEEISSEPDYEGALVVIK